ncbi:hypothetical protein QJ48_03110 [Paenibacillus sp. A3]|uniref:hypothetical protein n=1 Tax=Paenibacillus sp. A3 TaxID=1337054 RepID=UPI0006D5576C|nr:hypothetical protein [Paenibacillus sp. A3]KPV60898.1 hypothetical protein QJ48_03110 [Paenibacillus sp. A3]
MNLMIKIFFSSIELSAMIVFSLTLFRFQYKYYLPKIYGAALLMSLVTYYFREFTELKDLAILPTLSTQIILIMFIYRIPFFYSTLLCICGYIGGSVIEVFLMIAGVNLQVFTGEELQQSALVLGSVQISTAVILSIITFLLQRRKIGFLFKTKYLTFKTALKGYNFILSAILVVSVILVHLELSSFNQSSFSIALTLIMGGIFLTGILIAYKHNKTIIRETYERPVKDELDRAIREQDRKNHT